MTRTRSPSRGARGGTIAQPIDQPMLPVLAVLACCVFFFCPPNGQHITRAGRTSLVLPPKRSQSYLPPVSSSSLVPGKSGSGRAQKIFPLLPPFLPSVPIQAPDVSPAPATSSWSDWLVPLVLSFPVWSLPCTARQQQASTQTTLESRIIIERAFLFQEVTAAVVVPAIRGAHIKHATPHPHTRQGYARLHARPRLPVGPRIAIPACGLACRTCTRGGNPGDRQQNVWTSCWPLTGGKGHPLGAPWEFPGGQRGLLHGLRMAARLFRLGRILCTPPRLIAANCKTLCLGNSFPQWCRCSCYVAACWPLLFPRWPRDLGSTSLD